MLAGTNVFCAMRWMSAAVTASILSSVVKRSRQSPDSACCCAS